MRYGAGSKRAVGGVSSRWRRDPGKWKKGAGAGCWEGQSADVSGGTGGGQGFGVRIKLSSEKHWADGLLYKEPIMVVSVPFGIIQTLGLIGLSCKLGIPRCVCSIPFNSIQTS